MVTNSLVDFYERSLAPVCVDTQKLVAGDLFFALKGARSDGHHFVKEALAKGAKAAVVDYHYYHQQALAEKESLIPVDAPLEALQELARWKMARFCGQVVAITGSVGKTTTKEFLAHLLAIKFKVAASIGNYNSKIGLPISLLNHVPAETEVVVVEMGMSLAGELAHLVSIVPPDIAILTAVALAHAENFSSLQAIAEAKAEIFSSAKTRFAIVNKSICHYDNIFSKISCDKVSFALDDKEADYTLVNKNQLHIFHQKQLLSTFSKPTWLGVHNYQNLLAALIAAFRLGLTKDDIEAQIKSCSLPKKRLQLKIKNAITFIDDSYNATCVSMQAALDALVALPVSGKKIAVLGEMKELGAFASQCHRQIAEQALQKACVTIFVGQAFECAKDFSQVAHGQCYFAVNHDDLICLLKDMAVPGDAVLLKGSNLANLGAVYELF